MITKKIIASYYWILGLTITLYFIRTYFGEWLETQTYLKQHETLNDRPGICVPLPPFMTDIVILIIIGICFAWAENIKSRIYAKSKLTNAGYLELALLTIIFILPFTFFDFKLIQVITKLTMDYFSAKPI